MASHRSQKLKVYGGAEVDKLDNGRYRTTIRCEHDNNTEGWFEKYRADTFPEFNTLASAGFGTDPASAYDDQYYADQRLISASLKYIPQKTTPVVEFIYETLTSTWTNEVQDVESSTENGLRTLERTQVARPGTAAPYDEDDVGVETITSGDKTLYLAGFQDASTDRVGRFVTRWAEAGTLSVSTRLVNDGVKQTTYTYLGVEGVPTGTIIARRIGSHDGFRTFEIDVLTGKDDATLTGDEGASKLNHQYQQLVPFTFPGVVDLVQEQNHIFPSIRSPVEALVKADVLIYYQSSADIESSDFTLDSAIGIWNPSEWCQKISTIDSFVNDDFNVQPAYYNAQGIRGARTREAFGFFNLDAEIDTYSGLQALATLNLEESTTLVNGRSTYTQSIKYVYDITKQVLSVPGVRVSYGSRPVGGTYTVTCQWTGSAWEVIYSDVIVDRTATDAPGNDLYTYSARADGYSDTYTNSSSSTSGTLATSTSGGETPDLATWTAPVVVGAPSREETFAGGSLPANGDFGIAASGFWIEGRQVDNGAFGKISIEGGPPNPFGKRYVLDVNIKKAFDDVDGNTTWMKQVVIADVTPVS